MRQIRACVDQRDGNDERVEMLRAVDLVGGVRRRLRESDMLVPRTVDGFARRCITPEHAVRRCVRVRERGAGRREAVVNG